MIDALIDNNSDKEEFIRFPKIYQPRIKNYINIISAYSDAEFKSHFR